MSAALTIVGNKSLLESHFQPALNLGDKSECGLLYFSALNSIPNITHKNNVFAFGNKGRQLKIPCGIYDLYDIANYLESELSDIKIKIKANSNTLKCSLFCSEIVNFDVENNIAKLLGFENVKLEANKWHDSMNTVNIQPLSVIRIECDIVDGSYINGLPSHIIHEFVPNIPAGHRFVEIPSNTVYLPVNKSNISSINVKIVDEKGDLIDFREENIQIRLHLKQTI